MSIDFNSADFGMEIEQNSNSNYQKQLVNHLYNLYFRIKVESSVFNKQTKEIIGELEQNGNNQELKIKIDAHDQLLRNIQELIE